MTEIKCSLSDCTADDKLIIGQVVTISQIDNEPTDYEAGGLRTYNGITADGSTTIWMMFHPACFDALFTELLHQEQMVGLQLFLGPVGLTAEALGLDI
jgi:hypothetical protein